MTSVASDEKDPGILRMGERQCRMYRDRKRTLEKRGRKR
jgi:hypothetical protein